MDALHTINYKLIDNQLYKKQLCQLKCALMNVVIL